MLIKKMMISCKRATEMMEKKDLIGLTLLESFSLVFHTSICSACKLYKKQLVALNKLIENVVKSNDIQNVPQLKNPELKERLVQSVK